jgi:hypothetical protein
MLWATQHAARSTQKGSWAPQGHRAHSGTAAAKCCANHSAALDATASRAPGSGNRWVALWITSTTTSGQPARGEGMEGASGGWAARGALAHGKRDPWPQLFLAPGRAPPPRSHPCPAAVRSNPAPTRHAACRGLVELQHALVGAAHQQQRRRCHRCEPLAREVGAAAAGHDSGDAGAQVGGRPQRGAAACPCGQECGGRGG